MSNRETAGNSFEEYKSVMEEKIHKLQTAIANDENPETVDKLRSEVFTFQKEMQSQNFPDPHFQQMKYASEILTKLSHIKKPQDGEISAKKYLDDVGFEVDESQIKH